MTRIPYALIPALLVAASGEQAPAQTAPSAPASLNARLAGDIAPVHDPAIIRQGDTFYLFTTSQERDGKGLIHIRTSKDLVTWTRAPSAFAEMPAWVKDAVPGARGIWAPDVSFSHGEYRIYYSSRPSGRTARRSGW
jgi:arabinan endo-1,5-alpha-L-arabinosidase